MRPEVVALLVCPVCARHLRTAVGALRCEAGHSFDVARQGYVNLLPGGARVTTADTAAMVTARMRVLDAGHFAPLSAAVAATAARSAPPAGAVIDVGAGTGHHLAAVLDALPDRIGVAVDASKHAMRRAARAHPRAGAVVADAWKQLPIRDGVAAVVLSVFAPRHGAELARILAPGGTVLVVTPLADHLRTLVGELGLLTVDEHKAERLERRLGPALTCDTEREHRHQLTLDHGAVTDLVLMGPSVHHIDAPDLARRVATLPSPVRTQVAVRIARYRRRTDADT